MADYILAKLKEVFDKCGGTSNNLTAPTDSSIICTYNIAENTFGHPVFTGERGIRDISLGIVHILPTSITISLTTATFKKGEGITLSVTSLLPSTYVDGVNWTSSDESIATVENGVVKCAGTGTVIITVTPNYVDSFNKISASCTCTVKPDQVDGSGSVSISDWTYGGTASEPAPTSSTNGTDNVSYTWYNSSKTALSSRPTSTSTPGTYYIKATFAATDNYYEYTTDYVSFKINQASNSISVTGLTLTYPSSANLVTVTNSHSLTIYYAVGTQLTSSNYSSSGSTTIPAANGRNAGTYTVYWYTPGNTYYTSGSGSTSAKINQNNGSGSVSISDWTYGGTASEPAPSSSTNGTSNVTYTWYNSSKTSLSSRPTSTSTPGTYYIKATFAATTNYKAYTTDYVSFKINQAEHDITITGLTLTYPSSANLVSVTNSHSLTIYYAVGTQLTSSNYSSSGSTTIPTASSRNVNTYTVYWYTPGNTNYKSGSGSVKATINQGTGTGSVTINNWIYGGTASEPVPTSTTNGTDNVTYTWYNSSKTALSSRPTSTSTPGTYYIKATFAATTNYKAYTTDYVSFKINQADENITVSGLTLTYPSTANLVSVTNPNSLTIYYSVGTLLTSSNYSSSGSTSIPTASSRNANTYTVYWYTPGNTYYTSDSGSAKATINQAAHGITVTGLTLTYPSTANLVSVTNSHSLTIYYAVGTLLTSSNYSSSGSTSIPTASGRNVNTYTVYWYTPGNTNYTSGSGSAKATINQAAHGITVTGLTLTYPSSANLVTVTNPNSLTIYYSVGTLLTSSNYSSSGSTSIPTASSRNVNTYTVYWYTPGNTNYKSGSGSAKATINQGTGTGSVSISGWTYGDTASEPVPTSSTNGTSNVSYTWYNSTKTTLSSRPTSTSAPGTYYIKATFAATTNYKAYTTDYVSFTISQAAHGITVTGLTLTYPSTANLVTVTNSHSLTIYYSVGTLLTSSNYSSSGSTSIPTASGRNVNTYTVYWYTPGNTYYTSGSGSASAKINQNNGSGSVSISGWTYGDTASEPVPTSSTNGTSNVSYTWYNSSKTVLSSRPTSTSAPGTYYIKATFAATTNYKAYTTDYVSFTISQASNGISVTGLTLTYPSSANLVSTTNSHSLTIYYAVGTLLTSSNYSSSGSTTIPTASGRNVNTYTVYWYTPGNTYYTSGSGSANAKINQAENGISITGLTLTYPSTANLVSTTNSHSLTIYYAVGTQLTSSNYSSSGSTTIPTASSRNAGTYTVYWYTPGNTNYKSGSGSANATINQASSNDISVSGLTLTYPSSANLVSVSNSHSLTIYYAVGTTLTSSNYSSSGSTSIPTASGRNAGSYTVFWYTPGNTNYPAGSGYANATINQADSGISVSGKSLTYKSSSNSIAMVTVSNPNGLTIYYAVGTLLTSNNYGRFGSTSIPTQGTKDAGTYTIYWYTPGNTNYTSSSGYANTTISPDNSADFYTSTTSFPYTGSEITALSDDLNCTNCYISSGTTSATEAGKYTATATAYSNYCFPGNPTSSTSTITWYITAASNTVIKVGNGVDDVTREYSSSSGTITFSGVYAYPTVGGNITYSINQTASGWGVSVSSGTMTITYPAGLSVSSTAYSVVITATSSSQKSSYDSSYYDYTSCTNSWSFNLTITLATPTLEFNPGSIDFSSDDVTYNSSYNNFKSYGYKDFSPASQPDKTNQSNGTISYTLISYSPTVSSLKPWLSGSQIYITSEWISEISNNYSTSTTDSTRGVATIRATISASGNYDTTYIDGYFYVSFTYKNTTVYVTSVSVSVSPEILYIGGSTGTATATVYPTNATTRTVTWSSSPSSFLNVSSTGVLTAKSADSTTGTSNCTVTATSVGTTSSGSNVSGSKTVTVRRPVESVSLNYSTLTRNMSAVTDLSEDLEAEVSPSNAHDTSVTWSSSNASIASVNASTGELTLNSSGTCTITATSNGYKSDGTTHASASCTLIVKDTLQIAVNTIYIYDGAAVKSGLTVYGTPTSGLSVYIGTVQPTLPVYFDEGSSTTIYLTYSIDIGVYPINSHGDSIAPDGVSKYNTDEYTTMNSTYTLQDFNIEEKFVSNGTLYMYIVYQDSGNAYLELYNVNSSSSDSGSGSGSGTDVDIEDPDLEDPNVQQEGDQ